jgi:hypothetical protein
LEELKEKLALSLAQNAELNKKNTDDIPKLREKLEKAET